MCFIFCNWTCSVQLSTLHMEKCSRNTIIIIIITVMCISIEVYVWFVASG